MGKLIDADALKDWLEIVPLTGDGGVDINDLESWIAQQPTANAWIPCSEKLPSEADHINEMVLVCYRNGSVRFNTYMNGWVQGNPVAWMPLPKPWEDVTK